ncbi:MAG: hypothetical protein RMJ67_01185 [Elusimicrobiota bacterium]|nr:hypothetical protein [Endomicrobiia bacterium]MDW8165117.1 hypothetical protein [Elusimicrobiota bacterium]
MKNFLVYSGKFANFVLQNKDKIFPTFSNKIIVLDHYERNINFIYPLIDELVCEYIQYELNKNLELEEAHNLFLEYFDGTLNSVISALVLEYPIKKELRPLLLHEETKTGIVIYPILPSFRLISRQKLPSHFSFYNYYSLFSDVYVVFDKDGNLYFKI